MVLVLIFFPSASKYQHSGDCSTPKNNPTASIHIGLITSRFHNRQKQITTINPTRLGTPCDFSKCLMLARQLLMNTTRQPLGAPVFGLVKPLHSHPIKTFPIKSTKPPNHHIPRPSTPSTPYPHAFNQDTWFHSPNFVSQGLSPHGTHQ